MVRDAIEALITCNTAGCFVWHGILGAGALLLGLWFAFEIWCRPFREEARIYSNVLRDRARLREEQQRNLHVALGPGTSAHSGEGRTDSLREAAERVRKQRQSAALPELEAPLGWKAVDLARPSEPERSLAGAPLSPGSAGEEAVPESQDHAERAGGDPGARSRAALEKRKGEDRRTSTRPEDDLTLIEGISAELRTHLRELDVVSFEQIAGWSPVEIERISRELGIGKDVEQQGWVAQAKELEAIMEEVKPEAYADFMARWGEEPGEQVFPGEVLRCHESLGNVFVLPPEVRDDLNRIQSLSRELEQRLGELGIFRFKQIARWREGNLPLIEERLNLPAGTIAKGRWRQQAERLHREIYRGSDTWRTSAPPREEYEKRIETAYGGAQGEAVVDGSLGIIYLKAPPERDELTRIPGIGALMAASLRNCGVYRFRQIGDWSMANVQGFAARLKVPADRILQEQWIRRAAALADEVQPLQFPVVRRKLRTQFT